MDGSSYQLPATSCRRLSKSLVGWYLVAWREVQPLPCRTVPDTFIYASGVPNDPIGDSNMVAGLAFNVLDGIVYHFGSHKTVQLLYVVDSIGISESTKMVDSLRKV